MKLQFPFKMLFICFSIFISSCSDDDSVSNPTTEVIARNIKKVTQITYYSADNYETSVSDFIYNNDQLKKIHISGPVYNYDSEFVYGGDKITQVQYSENGSPDGVTNLFYEGDDLSYTLSGQNQDEKTLYTYDGGFVNSVKTYYPDGPDAELLQSKYYLYENGNVKKENVNSYFFGTSTTESTYTYDEKNNPLRGMNKYLRLTLSSEGFDGLSLNNPISRKSINTENGSVSEYYYEMKYNEDNYPTEIKRFASNNNSLISETIIEYR